ncbi:hypothetical protein AUJ46_00350 [Candidatus Peregrinibacteria bacterium CG1_02_54_53]|nr:MAG: hypothetical protein AUJ46_00350 [Candidatus Peregrinibacteria bacterium CG1_02_54_53]
MRIFALETDVEKLKKQFLSAGEQEVLMTYYHGLSFFFASLREMIISIVMVLVVAGAIWWGAPPWWTAGILFLLWFVFVFFNLLKAYIDWAYDFILVTTDKIIFVDQTSFFRQEIKPLNLENVGGVSVQTQYWNIFPFGIVSVHLKEGLGGDRIIKSYVPRAREVAAKISEVVTRYQRYDHQPENSG